VGHDGCADGQEPGRRGRGAWFPCVDSAVAAAVAWAGSAMKAAPTHDSPAADKRKSQRSTAYAYSYPKILGIQCVALYSTADEPDHVGVGSALYLKTSSGESVHESCGTGRLQQGVAGTLRLPFTNVFLREGECEGNSRRWLCGASKRILDFGLSKPRNPLSFERCKIQTRNARFPPNWRRPRPRPAVAASRRLQPAGMRKHRPFAVRLANVANRTHCCRS
jgi:hypothetical protein